MMPDREAVSDAFDQWYNSLKPMRQYGGRPAKGTLSAALTVLERLRESCSLQLQDHLAPGGAQIAGMSLSALRKILERYGEDRDFPSEGGRTNRGNNTPMRELLQSLKSAKLDKMAQAERLVLIDEMQRKLVDSLDAYYLLELIRIEFDPAVPFRIMVTKLLAQAGIRQQAGPVAQHLVGAKLAIRFPGKAVSNYSYSAADDPGGRAGDFQVGGTVFHVTVAPHKGHAAKCAKNLSDGLAVFLLVNHDNVERAHFLIDQEGIAGSVAVESIESFVGQNLAELAEFESGQVAPTWSQVLRMYNKRVAEVETDVSLQIEIPSALLGEEELG